MILNKKNNKILGKNYKLCRSLFSQGLGLMFSSPKTLVFEFSKEKIAPLHMFFVFFTIDVIFLDKNKKIVEIKENFRPFTFYNPKNKAKYVLELEKGIIKRTSSKIGDTIHLQ